MSGEKSSSKVKTFMGTPKAFKMKFFSVIGNSTSDIISGISNKVCFAKMINNFKNQLENCFYCEGYIKKIFHFKIDIFWCLSCVVYIIIIQF